MKSLPMLAAALAAGLLVSSVPSLAIDIVLRYPAPQDVTLTTVCWSGTQFIAAGNSGVILTSTDGTAWQPQTAPILRNWSCSASGGGHTFLAGDRGGMLESPDGVHWTKVTIPTDPTFPGIVEFTSLQHASFDAGSFFSSEGTTNTWVCNGSGNCTRVTAPLPHNALAGLARGPVDVVCLSAYHKSLLHFTGSAWTPVDMDPATPTVYRRLVWTGVRFIALSTRTIATSVDGINWTQRPVFPQVDLNEIVWSGSQAVVVGNSGLILTSPDGASWTERTSGTAKDLLDVAWSGSKFAAVGVDGATVISPDGATWTKIKEVSASPVRPRDVKWLSTGGYAFGDTTGTLRSVDGITWARTAATGPVAPVAGAATNGTNVVVAAYNGLWQGPADGTLWIPLGMSTPGVVWDGQRFCARLHYKLFPGSNGCDSVESTTSPDGVTWDHVRPFCQGGVFSDFGGQVGTLVWTGQRYLDFESSSADLISWQPHTGDVGSAGRILWTGSTALGVAGNGRVCTSPTGEVWTQRTPGIPGPGTVDLRSPVWTGSQLFATGMVASIGLYGIYDGTVPGTWTELLDVQSDSLAWTGSRVIFASSSAVFSIENLIPPPTTWQSWQAQQFPGISDPSIISANVDPDGDGVRNLIEYATGRSPVLRDSQPAVSVTPGAGGVAVDWVTDTSHTGVNLILQISGDLSVWDDLTGTVQSTVGSKVTKRYLAPPGGHFFFRLRAVLQ